ncbi:MAG: hypothetical protein WC781_05370 [Candidatus Pacearchaeota archaeon]|jgi:hypothetical protein
MDYNNYNVLNLKQIFYSQEDEGGASKLENSSEVKYTICGRPVVLAERSRRLIRNLRECAELGKRESNLRLWGGCERVWTKNSK